EMIRQQLETDRDSIDRQNMIDVETAQANQAPQSLVQRLLMKPAKWESLLDGLSSVARLQDPLSQVTLHTEITKGLTMKRITCPIGVLCIIYEARPEAGVQIASLAIKSGNALILKGGKEAMESNQAIY